MSASPIEAKPKTNNPTSHTRNGNGRGESARCENAVNSAVRIPTPSAGERRSAASVRLEIGRTRKLLAEGLTAELIERHVVAEFEADASPPWSGVAGLHLQEHEGSRWRAVLDTITCPLETLRSRGARDVRTQPLTLEELFLALTTK